MHNKVSSHQLTLDGSRHMLIGAVFCVNLKVVCAITDTVVGASLCTYLFLMGQEQTLTRLMPQTRLASTDWALRPTTTVPTPPTVSRGFTLMPKTDRHIRLPAHTTNQLASPLNGIITRSKALPWPPLGLGCTSCNAAVTVKPL